jgi:hypothetical protein
VIRAAYDSVLDRKLASKLRAADASAQSNTISTWVVVG